MKLGIPIFFTALLLSIGAFALFGLDSVVCWLDGETAATLNDTWSIRGQVGDILAGISSSIAMIWLIYSIWLQRAEFRAQTDEFKTSNYLQMVNRNYTHLSLLEKNLAYFVNDEEKEYFRNLLQAAKDGNSENIRVALQDLISIYNQILLVEETIEKAPDSIQSLLRKEFNVYSHSLVTEEFEKLLAHAYVNEVLIPLVPSTHNIGNYDPTTGDTPIKRMSDEEIESKCAAELRDFFSQPNQDTGIKRALFDFYKMSFKMNSVSLIAALDDSRDYKFPGDFEYANLFTAESNTEIM